MDIPFSIPPIVIGLIIGFSGSMLGALVDFIDSRRKKVGINNGGFLLVIGGLINTIAGVTAIIYSIITTGNILTAFFLGLGVLIGFGLGFLFFAGIWILLEGKDKTV